MHENRLKITNPQRINRIINRLCQAKLSVLIRNGDYRSIAVKGYAADLGLNGKMQGFQIEKISNEGMTHLKNSNVVQVEFVMMTSKIVFVAKIVDRSERSIYLHYPNFLVSLERRKSVRYNTHQDLTPFFVSTIWSANNNDLGFQPEFEHNAGLSRYFSIINISQNGFCCETLFPSAIDKIDNGMVDKNAKLILPMQNPHNVAIAIRWSKRIKEHQNIDNQKQKIVTYFRFGAEILEQKHETVLAIKQVLNQLVLATAI